MTRWRGIIVPTSQFASLRNSQLIAIGGDGGRYRAGDELLVVGRGQLRKIRSLRRDLDRDGGSSHIIQGTQRCAQSTHGNLPFLQFGGNCGCRGAAEL